MTIEERAEAIRFFETMLKLESNIKGAHFEYSKLALEALEQKPPTDAVSRQAVLEAIDKSKYSNEFCEEHHIDWSINLGMAHIVVNKLKPVAPQPKMGRWIAEINDYGEVTGWHCDKCYEDSGFTTTCKWDYCPNCGQPKMQEVEE